MCIRSNRRLLPLVVVLLLSGSLAFGEDYGSSGFSKGPYRFQVDRELARLQSADAATRANALENLSALRDFNTAEEVLPFLEDADPVVRREAAMNLGWVGTRDCLKPLVEALRDEDWAVRQAAATALTNLTAHKQPFDALAAKADRETAVSAWEEFISGSVAKVLQMRLQAGAAELSAETFYELGDIVRAIGFMRVEPAAPAVIGLLEPYRKRQSRLRQEKIFVQACVRTLGLLGKGKGLLIALLENPQWAVYAADALGEVGGEDAAAALLKAFPDYAKSVSGMTRRRSSYRGHVRKFHSSDAPRLSSIDRIPRVSHAILHALSRIPFQSENNLAALRRIVPFILSSMPSDFDATVVYSEEPYQMLAGFLIERSGLRRVVVDAAFFALGMKGGTIEESVPHRKEILAAARANAQSTRSTDPPFAGPILMSCSREKEDIPLLIKLLTFEANGWVRIHAAKTLLFMGATEAIPKLVTLLMEARDDADYGYDMDFRRFQENNVGGKKLPGRGYDEYNDPSPRYKEAYIMALGGLHAAQAVPILIRYLNNDRNVIEIQYAAAMALSQIATPEALAALREAEAEHPVASVKLVAGEALWRNGMKPRKVPDMTKTRTLEQLPVPTGKPAAIVFIKGPFDAGNHEQISSDNTGYSTTDGGPTYRLGYNICRFQTANPEGTCKQLTHFKEGFVADLEVSFDGKRLLFCHRGPSKNPWWHIYEMKADGSDLRQLTSGPYHDVQPNYMPDGRIVFSTTRLGVRDEYHGYAATGLAVMNHDGTDIHVIGFNLGRDAEPVVGANGKILFSRLELFYSRMKTEWNLLSVMPDGTMPITHYGPERRHIWRRIRGASSLAPPRHRVLRITQPQSWNGSEYLINSFRGPMITGPGHLQERFLAKDNSYAITTPYKLDDKTLLVAAGKRPVRNGRGGYKLNAAVDHGIYYMDVQTGKLSLIYNDPKAGDFEARPLQPRPIPPLRPEGPFTRTGRFTGTILCNSIYTTRHEDVKIRGRYVRITEGLPTVTRHQTHKDGGVAWRNHGGAIGRHLGTVPVAADGSFAISVPADRLFHCQVLDADKNVVGNELIWQYSRPGEAKSCVGCHEKPDITPVSSSFPSAHRQAPLRCLPSSRPLLHHAKLWFKGHTPDEREERMRTVNSVNLLGRQ